MALRIKYKFFITFLSISFYLNSQSPLEIWKQKAEYYRRSNHLTQSIFYYKKIFKSGCLDNDLMLNMASCYKKLNQNSSAVKIYRYLLDHNKLPDSALYTYYHCLKKCTPHQQIPKILAKANLSNPYKIIIAELDSISAFLSPARNVKITEMTNINTSYSEIGACYNKQWGLVYLSNQESTIIKRRNPTLWMPVYDIFYAPCNTSDSLHFEKGKGFYKLPYSGYSEGGFCFSKDLSQIYYSRAERVSDSIYSYKLYMCEKKGSAWGNPMKFAFNDSLSSFNHPFLSNDGQLFFFSSDMPGGYGGFDIYVCALIDSVWSAPINLGPIINTKGNETFPFLAEDQEVLYFSSNGHVSIGGYDLFKATQVNGEWNQVENLKAPFNTSADDISIYFINSKSGFISSNRGKESTLEDIYLFQIK